MYDITEVDVSGVPGTGKTATFRNVLKCLQKAVDDNVAFIYQGS